MARLIAVTALTLIAQVAWASTSLVVLDSAELLVSGGEAPPEHGRWQTTSLPDRWPPSRYQTADTGWYRFSLPKPNVTPANDNAGFAVWIPRLNMNVAVYFNGSFVGDGGPFSEPMARNWNRGLLFSIPAGLWQVEGNELLVRLKSYPGYGRLDPVLVGPYQELIVHHRWQRFWRVDLNIGLLALTLAIALYMLLLWSRRRGDRIYFWFGISALTWSIFSLNTFILVPPMSAHWWDWLVYSLTAWWTTTLSVFCFRYCQIEVKRFEQLIFLWAIISTLVYAVTSLEKISVMTAWFQSGSLVVGTGTVLLMLRQWRRSGDRKILLLSISILLVLAAGIHDWLSQNVLESGILQIGTHLLQFTEPLVFLFVGWHLTGHFITGLNQLERLNNELELRVADGIRQLEDSLTITRQLEKKQAISAERERIFQDLHDDVGAKLLSLMHQSSSAESAELARSALQDLRSIVSRSGIDEIPVLDLLSDCRAEFMNRLEYAGVDAAWNQEDEIPNIIVDPRFATDLERIIRETLNNALKHSSPSAVVATVGYQPPNLTLIVDDNGSGQPPAAWKEGRGLSNMKMRIQRHQGEILWTDRTPTGASVRFRLPLQGSCLGGHQPAHG